jgi:transposase
MRMKKQSQDLIAEGPCSSSKVEMTIGIDLGDVWSHYCTLNQEGGVVDRGRFRTTPTGAERWFTDLPPVRIAKTCTSKKTPRRLRGEGAS